MRHALGAALLMAAGACTGDDAANRRASMGSAAARELVGAWSIRLTIDSATSTPRFARAPGAVSGTVAFVLDRSGPPSSNNLAGLTHEGTYDLDVSPFGFSTHANGAPSVAVARVAPRGTRLMGRAGDSLWIVLSPENDRFPIRMEGVLSGDSVIGVWNARAFSAGGGTGHFVMRRRSAFPDSSPTVRHAH